jgi:hypothetical protein
MPDLSGKVPAENCSDPPALSPVPGGRADPTGGGSADLFGSAPSPDLRRPACRRFARSGRRPDPCGECLHPRSGQAFPFDRVFALARPGVSIDENEATVDDLKRAFRQRIRRPSSRCSARSRRPSAGSPAAGLGAHSRAVMVPKTGVRTGCCGRGLSVWRRACRCACRTVCPALAGRSAAGTSGVLP